MIPSYSVVEKLELLCPELSIALPRTDCTTFTPTFRFAQPNRAWPLSNPSRLIAQPMLSVKMLFQINVLAFDQ